MSLNPEAFRNIKEGKQRIELRLFDEKRQKVHPGDAITFSRLPDKTGQISVDVVGLSIFPSFKALFETLGESVTGCTLPELLRWRDATYTEQEETTYGVIGIHIRIRN